MARWYLQWRANAHIDERNAGRKAALKLLQASYLSAPKKGRAMPSWNVAPLRAFTSCMSFHQPPQCHVQTNGHLSLADPSIDDFVDKRNDASRTPLS